MGAGLLGARAAGAQVTQAQCGNVICASSPGVCANGCVCCVYANGNSRCRPPGTCAPGTVACPPGQVLGPSGVCAAPTTTPAPTTTTTACPGTTCGGGCCLPAQDACLANGSCAETCGIGVPCPLGCACSLFSAEGPSHCIVSGLGCEAIPQACTGTAGCPPGQHCQTTFCGPGGTSENRCLPLCTAT